MLDVRLSFSYKKVVYLGLSVISFCRFLFKGASLFVVYFDQRFDAAYSKYCDNIFVKRSIPTVCFVHIGIKPSTWGPLLIRRILWYCNFSGKFNTPLWMVQVWVIIFVFKFDFILKTLFVLRKNTFSLVKTIC